MRSRREHAEIHDADRRRMVAQLDAMSSDEALAEHLSEERALGRQRGAVIALCVLVVLQIGLVTSLAWYPAIAAKLHLQLHPGVWPYIAAVACFLPLLFRRGNPVLALVLTSVFTGFYLVMPWPPAIVILAPMTALFTVAERYGGRRAVPIGIVLGVVVLGVSAMTVSVSYTVTQAVAIFALLGLAAALGHGAQTRRELFEEVRQKREEESLRRVEEERLRIARDVHDIMAHSLTLMTLQADAGSTTADDPAKARAAFTIIGDTGRATLRDLRSMLAVLAGDEGDDSPRQPVPDLGQLEQLVGAIRETGLEVTLEVDGELDAVPSTVSVSAYRIAQEALTNVVRHANARHADVAVTIDAARLTLTVTDDGGGGHAEEVGAGRGLLGMAERAEVLGGTISAGPGPAGGFEVSAEIPLTRSATCRSE